MHSISIENLYKRHPRIVEEVRAKVERRTAAGLESLRAPAGELEVFLEANSRPSRFEALETPTRRSKPLQGRAAAYEAIVLREGRPTLLVQDGTYVVPPDAVAAVKELIATFNREVINHVIAHSARLELLDAPRMPYVGTCWVIAKPKKNRAIVVTNRHVASVFASADGHGGYQFLTAPNMREYRAQIDFAEEYNGGNPREAPIVKVLMIAGANEPDIALLEVEGLLVENAGIIELSSKQPKVDAEIGVVGYPAYDSRNDADAVAQYFGDIFNVKRFSYGNVIGVSSSFPEFTHDVTTLGGNSGSVVFDRGDGKAIGLHYAGDYRVGNYAVPADQIARALAGLTTNVFISRGGTEAPGDKRNPPSHYKGRDGYRAAFLGSDFKVDLPGPGDKWADDLVTIKDVDTGKRSVNIKYRHFSVTMCASRRLPLFTAVNIDGTKSKRLGRVDTWYIDGRIPDELQVDNAAYARNALDRGHMVRREDPVWGTIDAASEANVDSFHYSNCAPQHEALNQRDWVQLEDYILGSARAHKLRVSVFTGPIFADDDRLYRGIVRLPQSFWKIAVMVDHKTKRLSATGYVLCQGELIKKITEAFVYGQFRTYQVPLALVQEQSGLDLAALLPADPLGKKRAREGIARTSERLFQPINSSADLILD